jgi:membrane protein implicated in regulation of membrane protease activity
MLDVIFSPIYFWLFFGLGLVIVEFIIPSFFIIFFGVGAWITAFSVKIFPSMPLWGAMIIFIVSSIILLVLLRAKFAPIFQGDSNGNGEENDNSNVGVEAEVIEKISPARRGKIKMQGTYWSATSKGEIEVGEIVIVEAAIPNEPLSYIVNKK